MAERVVDRAADKVLGRRRKNRFDANARVSVDLVPKPAEEVDELGGAVRTFLKLDSGVDVFRVLAEDDDVNKFRARDRRGYAFEIANGPDAGIEIEDLAQCHIERTDATPDWSRQRPLDGNREMLNRVEVSLCH